jgi:hypothetical protein
LILAGGILAALGFVAIVGIGVLVAFAVSESRRSAPRVDAGSPAAGRPSAPQETAGPQPDPLGAKVLADDAGPDKKVLADDAGPPATKPLGRDGPSPPGHVAPIPSEPKREPDPPPGTTGKMPLSHSEITFLNTTAKGQRFCIIADNSGSMTGEPMEFVKRELVKTLGGLKPESQFYVMFFNSQTEPMPFDGWLNGKPEDVKKVSNWIREKKADGGTEPQPAFVRAFELDPRPDVIFFMTDGLIPFNVPDAVAEMNAGKPRVTIHTIMFTSDQPNPLGAFMPAITADDLQTAERLLRKIADDSGGTYRLFTPWTPEDLAKAAEAGDEKRLAQAILYIPRMGAEVRKVIPRLLAALPKAPDGARALIVEALARMGPLEPAHVPALVSLLEGSSEPLQLFALAALASLRGKARDAVAPMSALFTRSEKPAVLLAIIKVLGQVVGPDRSLIDLYRDRGLKKSALPVRLASLAALREIGGDALPFRLLVELSFSDADDALRRAAQAILGERMKGAAEGDLADVRTLLGMKAHPDAVRLGLLGVTRLGPKARDCLPAVLDVFAGDDDEVCKASVPALRALGPAARPAVEPLAERLPRCPPKRQMEIALVLTAIDPADPKVARAVTPLLVRNLHPDALDKNGPPEMLLESIKVIGAPTVPLIFAVLEESAGQRGAVAANHRKYLFLALERLGPVAYSEANLEKVRAYTSPKVELYQDVRTAAGKARRAMTP